MASHYPIAKAERSADNRFRTQPAEPANLGLKQKVTHEFEELAILSAYLAVFFCLLTTYTLITVDTSRFSYFAYVTDLVNALIIAKVILIGEAVHAGKRYESKAVVYSAAWKALVFACLVFAFHIAEEIIKGIVHRITIADTLHGLLLIHLASRLVVRTALVFCMFIPLFIVRELRRVMGAEQFRTLFLHAA